ncbi:hypothetical protein ACQPYA_12965 [Micromonospora sp. CA-263727]|uniref:hypothetical protein n=1 Tax=Micromonospora sp. CA-263727 TaxID=3239967 RepID=UPI003D946C25
MARGKRHQLPVSASAAAWLTLKNCRTVLAVVHNVTALTRLVDVLAVLESDPRVQVVFTVTRSSPFEHGITDRLRELGCIAIPWKRAVRLRFDLAVSASHGGDLHQLNAPLVIVPHGLGYNKCLRAPSAERRAPSAERRAPSAERRAPSAERRAPSAERRAPSAERRAPSAERRAPSAEPSGWPPNG